MPTFTTPTCVHCGEAGTVELSEQELVTIKNTRHIQDAIPNRTPEEREQIMTGTHAVCWNVMFPPDED